MCRLGEINNITPVCSGVTELPYEDNFFDAVFCYGVIFLTPWKDTLNEFRRVLRPGGKLYFNFNEIGWYIFLWQTEHNKADDYDPKLIASKSFNQTLDYERNLREYKEGDHYIINSNDVCSILRDIGFENTFCSEEGSIAITEGSQSLNFVKGMYMGLPCASEILTFKN